MLSAVGTNEGIELLMNRMAKTENNAQFLATLIKQAQADRGELPAVATTDEREELRQLRRRVRELEQEREILKRATAFFVRESDRR